MNTTEKELHRIATVLDNIYKELKRYNNNYEAINACNCPPFVGFQPRENDNDR